jgi:hypothetical protein
MKVKKVQIFLISVFACACSEIETTNLELNGIKVSDAKHWYDANKSQKSRLQISEDIEWSSSEVFQINGVTVVKANVKYTGGRIGGKIWDSQDLNYFGKKSEADLNISEKIEVRLESGYYSAKRIVSIPLSSGENLNDKTASFSGYIIESDISGEFIKGSIVMGGKTVGLLLDKMVSNSKADARITCIDVVVDWYQTVCSEFGCHTSYLDSDTYTFCGDDGKSGGGSGTGESGGSSSSTTQSPDLSKITASNKLTRDQTQRLNQALAEFIKKCGGLSVYNNLTRLGVKINFKTSTEISEPANFNYATSSITFRDLGSINEGSLAEELFHAYQNAFYPGGLAIYTNKGRSNIEYEAKLFYDINNGGICCMVFQGSQVYTHYFNWLYEKTNGFTTYPDNFQTLSDKYFYFLEEFKKEKASYNYPTDINLKPLALLHANGPCNSN